MTVNSLKRSPFYSRKRRVQGFTLLEMMAALTAGLIAIGSIYTLGSTTSKHFHEQQRISQTQMSLRMAMMRITRDIARAGFGGTPSTRADLNAGIGCGQTPTNGHFSAIGFQDNQDTANLPNAAVNGVQADRIQLIGNYNTSDVFRVMPAASNAVVLQPNWQAFRRSFGIVGSTFDTVAFQNAFSPGSTLHIRTVGGHHIYRQITAVNPTTQTVQFNPGFSCGGERLNMAMVAPLSRVVYRVVGPTDENVNLDRIFGDSVQQNLDAVRGTQNSVLIRQNFNVAGNPIAGTEQIVLEYVADFDLQFIVDTQTAPGLPPIYALEQGAAGNTPNVLNNPHRIRSVIVNLSARTADHDRTFPFVARAAGASLTRYQLVPTLEGAARVRSMRSEVQLRNMRVIRP